MIETMPKIKELRCKKCDRLLYRYGHAYTLTEESDKKILVSIEIQCRYHTCKEINELNFRAL